MKKLLFGIFIIPIFLMFIPMSKAQAAYSAPNGNDYDYYCNTGYYNIYSDIPLYIAKDSYYNGDSGKNYYVLAVYDNSGTKGSYYVTSKQSGGVTLSELYPNNTISGIEYNGIMIYRNNTIISGGSRMAVGASSVNNSNVTLYDTVQDGFEELSVPPFELSDMKNDFNISAPSLVVENVLVGGNNPYKVPYKIALYDHAWDEESQNPRPLYLYMVVRYWSPSSVIGTTSNGFQYWSVKRYRASTGIVLNTFLTGDALPSSGSSEFNMNDVQEFIEGWQQFRSGITTEFSGEFASDTQQTSWNDYAKNAGIYGNRVEIYCCYFYESNGEYYSGLWTHWISDQPQEVSVKQVGDVNQNNGKEANGTTSIVMPDSAKTSVENENPNMPANIPNNATNVNVTINNPSVPNNMNYPTVTSYNHDNIFTQFIGTYTNANAYLGGFVSFLNGVMLWVPAEIWAIIGVGMAMAIVIMVVKIL